MVKLSNFTPARSKLRYIILLNPNLLFITPKACSTLALILAQLTFYSFSLSLNSGAGSFPAVPFEHYSYDNGNEFSGHEIANRYIQNPIFVYHSWEKGSIENMN